MIYRLLSRISGLSALEVQYTTDKMPVRFMLTGETIQIGAVRYRRCVGFHAGESGLFLQIKTPLWKTRSLLIPWRDLKQTGYTRIYGETAVSFAVGNNIAGLAVPLRLFNMMNPYLDTGQG